MDRSGCSRRIGSDPVAGAQQVCEADGCGDGYEAERDDGCRAECVTVSVCGRAVGAEAGEEHGADHGLAHREADALAGLEHPPAVLPVTGSTSIRVSAWFE